MCLLAGACAVPGRATDEQALRAGAEKEDAALLKRVKVYEDPRLAEYLTSLAGRLLQDTVGAAGAPGIRIIVIEDPTLAAFAMPNGRIYVHTGLLSRVENEAQLATILARELAHYGQGHASALAAHGFTKPPHTDLSPTAAAILGLGLRLAATAAISGYGGDREREADAEGMQRLTAAGYDAHEALNVFQLLATGGTDGGALEIFFYGNRPRMGERYETTREWLRTTDAARTAASGGGGGGGEAFARRMRQVVRDNAALDIRAGRFRLAQQQLDRVLALAPDDPIAELYYGDLYRLQSQRAPAGEGTAYTRKALGRYERAVALDPTYAAPFRQLGILYYQERNTAKARGAFEKYLALVPDAADARRIREYLEVVGDHRP